MASPKKPNPEKYVKKEIELESKNVDIETGEISGLSTIFNDIDQVDDTLLPGSFTKTLDQGGADRPLLWQHNHSMPIGTAVHKQTDAALELSGVICKEVQQGRETLALLKMKAIKGISIGFEIKDDQFTSKGVREIKEAKLWESSIVTFPCLLSAQVTAVKAMKQLSSKDFLNFLDHLSRHEIEMKKNEKYLVEAKDKINAILYSISEEKESALFSNSSFDIDDKESANMEKANSELTEIINLIKRG